MLDLSRLSPETPRHIVAMVSDPANHLPDGRIVTKWGECPKHGRFPVWVLALAKDGFASQVLADALNGEDCPECAAEKKHAEKFKHLAIPRRFAGCTVNNFIAKTEKQTKVRRFVVDFCRNIDARLDHGDSLIFTGRCGTGKTHLACSIARCAITHGRSAQFVTVRELIRDVRESWRPGSSFSEKDVLAKFTSLDLLVIDEIGVQVGSENECLILFDVINARYADMRSTILLTNLPVTRAKDPQDSQDSQEADVKYLEDFLGQRIIDRFRETGSAALGFDWPSFRGQAHTEVA